MPFHVGFPILGDIDLTDGGRDLALVSGPAGVAQSIKSRAQIYKGSWRYDLSKGMPYFDEILVAGANLDLVRRRFYDLVAQTPGVSSVVSVKVRIDRTTGTMYVDFVVIVDGETVDGTLDFPAAG